MADKRKVFLDSSVIIAALLSSSGGSFYVLTQLAGRLEFIVNEYVFAEVQEILKTKFANRHELGQTFFLLMSTAKVRIVPDPLKTEVARSVKIISKNDAPILASALAHAEYLVTLDNEFLEERVLRLADVKDLIVLKPGYLIALFNSR